MTYRQPDGSGICVGRHRYEPERPRGAMPGTHLCGGCYARLERLLTDLPNLCDDLERALLNGSSGQGPKVSGSPTRPLPYNDAASEARRQIIDVLSSWTRIVAEEREEHLPTDLSPRGQAKWHGYRLGVWIAAQDWIDEYASNLSESVAEGRRVLAGSRSRTIALGPCAGADRCDVETQAEVACVGEIRARVDLVDELLPAAVACTGCGQVHTARELPALGKALTGGVSWLTTAQAAHILGLSEMQTARRAREEGWHRRDAEKVRPSRWNSEDVQASRGRYERKGQAS